MAMPLWRPLNLGTFACQRVSMNECPDGRWSVSQSSGSHDSDSRRCNRHTFRYKYSHSSSPHSLATRSPRALAFFDHPHTLPRRPRSPSTSSAGSTMKFSASFVILALAVAASASPLNMPRERGGDQRGHPGKGGHHHKGPAASSSVRATSSSSAVFVAKSSSVVGSATAVASGSKAAGSTAATASGAKAVGTTLSAASASVANGATGVASSVGTAAVCLFFFLTACPY